MVKKARVAFQSGLKKAFGVIEFEDSDLKDEMVQENACSLMNSFSTDGRVGYS